MTTLPYTSRRDCSVRAVCVLVVRLFLCSFFSPAVFARAEIPPRPAAEHFLHDLAGTISDVEEQQIRGLQEQVFRQVKVPIVVVTVNRMRDYDPGAPSIESFAHRWFDTWEIGSKKKNDGILVIISTEDRKGRIELGDDWKHGFDDYCQRIIDKDMIPHFKSGDYGAGIAAGVEQLAEMAKAGPNSEPPEPGLGERFGSIRRFLDQHNPIASKGGPVVIILMILAGVGCFVAAYFFPYFRRALLIMGMLLIHFAVLFWIALILVAVVVQQIGDGGGRFGRSVGSGFGGSFGGGFGGGFSGGGGASGSW